MAKEATKPQRTRVLPAPTTFRSPDSGTRFRAHNGSYTDAIARKICERLMLTESLKNICADPKMPSMPTVARWLTDPRLTEFREMYYFARRVAAELLVDEIIEIADESEDDWKPVHNKDGELIDWKPDNEAIQRSRVRIDTRKWYASKMVPRIYGDKVEVDLDATGDLAELLKAASNNDNGLPTPIED